MPAFAGMTAVEGVTVVACHGDALRPLDTRHDAVTSPRHNPFVLYACEITGSTSRPPEGGRSICGVTLKTDDKNRLKSMVYRLLADS
jgi:hypothetical protein